MEIYGDGLLLYTEEISTKILKTYGLKDTSPMGNLIL